MRNTTSTSETTEQNARQKAITSMVELDMRDYFAAKALEGLISKMAFELHADHEKAKEVHKCLAQSAYSYADAMLAEREK